MKATTNAIVVTVRGNHQPDGSTLRVPAHATFTKRRVRRQAPYYGPNTKFYGEDA